MAIDSGLSQSTRSAVLAQLRTLRATLALARDLLMHYKDDRVDRDKLEPAARRVDALMDMFASDLQDTQRAAAWVSEIQAGVDEVTNPKATVPLDSARLQIPVLLEEIGRREPREYH